DVDIVNLDVVVTDKQGKPITGLTREDFTIFEDGEPMELTNFSAIERDATGESEAGEAEAAIGDPAAAALPEQDRPFNLVIFVDNLNMRPENRKALFENLRKTLRSEVIPAASSQVMVVAMNRRVEVIEPFTRDIERVFAALDVLEKQTSINALADSQRRMFLHKLARSSVQDFECGRRPPPPPPPAGGGTTGTGTGTGNGSGWRSFSSGSSFRHALRDAEELAREVMRLGEQRYQAGRSAVQAMRAFSDTLGGLSGRKALLYLSDGLAMRPAEALSEAWIAKYALWIQTHGECVNPSPGSDLGRAMTGAGARQFNLRGELSRLREQAADNQVAFYPISTHGKASALMSAEIPGSTDGTSGTMIRMAMITEAQDRAATLMRIAEDTGGVALTSTANVGELFDRMQRDFSTYYSLGYRAPEAKRDNAYHKIRVEVRHEGVEVRHVHGRRDKSWIDRLGDMTVAAALFDINSNPLGIRLQRGEPVAEGKRFKAPILVEIPFDAIELVEVDQHFSAHVTLLTVVRDNKGGFSKPRQFDLPIQIPRAQIAKARGKAAAYPLELNMKKNAEVVAIGVRDNIGQTASSVTLAYDFGGGDDDEPKKKKRKKRRRSG
ncbi:MAG: VWA domain-containing protein, partial [Acidobacteriota bacterium]